MDTKDKDIRRKRLGREGEDIACDLLQSRGMEVLERNWRSSHKEIDIICRDDADLRFVEVKSRREPMEGEPWEAVTAVKQRRIGSAAKSYVCSDKFKSLGFSLSECHFDVITVVWDEKGENHSVEYIPDAYILIYV